MGSTLKKLGLLDSNGQKSNDPRASRPEKRGRRGFGPGEWLVNVASDVVVPMSTAEIVEGLRAAKLSARSLVWRSGMPDWSVLGEVPQFRLAAGTATTSAPPAAAPTVPLRPTERREPPRRGILPHGFPLARHPVSPRQASGSTPSPALSVPESPAPARAATETSTVDSGFTVYARPTANLTSPHAPDLTHGAARRFTPLPPVAARAIVAHSLIPTTSELESRTHSRALVLADPSALDVADGPAAKSAPKRVARWAGASAVLLAASLGLRSLRTASLEPSAASAAARPVSMPSAAPRVAPRAPEVQAANAVTPIPRARVVLAKAALPPRSKGAPPARLEAAPQAPAATIEIEPHQSDNPYGPSPSETSEPGATTPPATTAPAVNSAPRDSRPAPAPAIVDGALAAPASNSLAAP